jgi:hypothetical protein
MCDKDGQGKAFEARRDDFDALEGKSEFTAAAH